MGPHKKHRKRSASPSDSSSTVQRKKSRSDSSKKKKRKSKHKKHVSSSSDSSSSDSTSSSSSSHQKLKKSKKLKDKTKKRKSEVTSSDIPVELMAKSKAMAPMTKEQWEKQQSVVRRVYDETTGRHRLIKGDGEVIEEIVSRDRHKAINQQATRGDGEFFQAQMFNRLKK
ncbi:ADP-ribosylation factor-like protein 6-interacting protein 4 [Tribolium castaneum]|uniref:ADP-ribosylation factor-like protein 6-interacting protein 4 n=1 Tax=Tribolium castaneum TaxID=7070 RepID=D6WEC8_TRICA|nr:PREDICTED: ADP-ribosylation factor-like protein 6-interacting protein 4 [Tribolium castaneum]EFA00863.1 ADP-ribosylation factor-like protein 6-interacting protein 4 [Tribolium castaneum]|eukprot:XP_968591.1 PREDICTED: ADP-ribosylation factor-like protein 6-interacting protein 4 [Tribolium castaneum]